MSLGNVAKYIESFGLLLNLVTLCLILRQGLKSPDMQLALILAVCDVCLVSSKLGLYIYYKTTNDFGIFKKEWFGQLDGLFMCLFISTSILCVGYLALLRCWAIFFKRRINIKVWFRFFAAQQGLLAFLLTLTAVNGEFKLSPFDRFFHPNPYSLNPVTRSCSLLLSLWILFSFVAVNVTYPAICYVYLHQIDTAAICLDWRPKIIARHHFLKKITIILRISILMLIYNIFMLPAFVITMKGYIQHQNNSVTLDSLLTLSLLCLVIVNPLTLIFLHQDIINDVKIIFHSMFRPKLPTDIQIHPSL
ncbi:hypothetical protein DSO57_1029872 [Entomophthora muscae]|uniref:Uncharacterized protein n=1 Tax=Entomophthora muscae TaxID=34485 RepID=A0ACC2U049_9FUNG|nr:hypothetical protein DSO57_1029872 [Entomophthora muscae]